MNSKTVAGVRKPNRRDFLRTTSQVAAASALAGIAIPAVHAAEDNTLRIALIGCGGRGGGAAANALATTGGPVKLVAMADLFENQIKIRHDSLKKQFGANVE